MVRFFFVLIFIPFFLPKTNAQYITNGNASIINCHCYQLTDSITFQRGSVWNANKIDLSVPFDFSFDINFGCADVNGADGIAFILQPISTSVGGTGSGLGFQGIVPSLGVLLDTYQNTTEGDPAYDHISINKNGDVLHGSANNLIGPIQIASGNDNVEDCNWHILRVVWNPALNDFRTFFDGTLRLQTTVNMVSTIFGGNPQVYWGFSAATGGLANKQKFCTRLANQINTGIINNDTCFGAPVSFSATIDAFIPLVQYYWNFGDGNTSNAQNPPPHLYSAPGQYLVKFVVKAIDGCDSDTAYQTVTIGDVPVAGFTVNDTCIGLPVHLVSTSTIASGSSISEYIWIVDGITLANSPSITSTGFAVGTHTVKHLVKSSIGCKSDTAFGSFTVFDKPVSSFTVADTCEGKPTIITSTATGINLTYFWLVDGIAIPNAPIVTNNYAAGVHTVQHYVQNTSGCYSDTITGSFTVFVQPNANFTVQDTCAGAPVFFSALSAGASFTYQWLVDGVPVASTPTFSASTFSVGVHTVTLMVTNNGKCGVTKNGLFTIQAKPLISGSATSVCLGTATNFTAVLNNPPINNLSFHWFFSDGSTQTGLTASKTFSGSGQGTVKLLAKSLNACNSDTVSVVYTVVQPSVFAGNDTLVVQNQNFSLTASATGNGLVYNWQPASFFSNNTVPNPATVLNSDQLFVVTVTTAEGCVATDDIVVKVFKGSKIYVPNAFTPNGDGKNDILLPLYIGIRNLDYFNIYNRWGQKVFSTVRMNEGWNATFLSTSQPSGNYIYQLKATDLFGKEIIQKGSILIIR